MVRELDRWHAYRWLGLTDNIVPNGNLRQHYVDLTRGTGPIRTRRLGAGRPRSSACLPGARGGRLSPAGMGNLGMDHPDQSRGLT